MAFYTQGILYCAYIGTAQIHIFFVLGMIIDKTKIQQEVYSKNWCFAHGMLSCLPSWNLCKMYGPMQEFFPGLLYVHEFFSLNFPLHEFFFGTSPAPHNFPNGSSLTLSSTRRAKQHNCQENQ